MTEIGQQDRSATSQGDFDLSLGILFDKGSESEDARLQPVLIEFDRTTGSSGRKADRVKSVERKKMTNRYRTEKVRELHRQFGV